MVNFASTARTPVHSCCTWPVAEQRHRRCGMGDKDEHEVQKTADGAHFVFQGPFALLYWASTHLICAACRDTPILCKGNGSDRLPVVRERLLANAGPGLPQPRSAVVFEGARYQEGVVATPRDLRHGCEEGGILWCWRSG